MDPLFMSQYYPILVYCFLIFIVSLAGGYLANLIKMTHRRVQLIISAIAGFMLGVGMFHLLPHASLSGLSVKDLAFWMVLGIITMFFLERFFQYHTHEIPTQADAKTHQECHHQPNGHEHVHGHDAHHCHVDHSFCLSWTGATIGLTIHSLIAGIALAASVQTDNGWAGGFAIFLVIFLHKPFDSMTLMTLFKLGDGSVTRRLWINLLFALAIPLGAGLFYLLLHLGIDGSALGHSKIVGIGLAFAAGSFVCIAMSDLLPELHFHSHDRWKLSFLFLLGLTLAWGISEIENKTHHHQASDQNHIEHHNHQPHETPHEKHHEKLPYHLKKQAHPNHDIHLHH